MYNDKFDSNLISAKSVARAAEERARQSQKVLETQKREAENAAHLSEASIALERLLNIKVNQETQDKHNNRIDRYLQISIPLLFFVLGLVVDHFSGILRFVIDLFK